MAVDVVQSSGGAGRPTRAAGALQGLPARIASFVRGLPGAYRSIMAEMRRVTWPSREEIRKMSVAVIMLSLGIGAVIALIDFILQQVLVRWIPQLFAR
jgi:preprotein translocase SecE subunit